MTPSRIALILATAALSVSAPFAQPQFGPGPGGMNQPERKVVKDFDKDGNGRLNTEERKAAREFLATQPAGGPGGRGGRGGGGRMGGMGGTPQTGPTITPAQVKPATTPLYDQGTLRTIFLTFDNADWEAELEAFHNTDVEVPATMEVDGKTYKEVGIHFRGASSYMMVPRGFKRSLNVTMDFADEKQELYGYRTLNLNNANGDPSLMRAVVYETISRNYIPTSAANLVRVVINGEYWGVYTNVAQFNKDFLRDHFKTTDGARWKVPGSPGGRGGLEYLGEDVAAYQRLYEIKTKDTPEMWKAFINLTKVLNQTPAEQLEAALSPILDIEGTLKFLAVENALVNSDGYWTRASDYSLYLDPKGRFHVIPHDINEAMLAGGGRGGGPMGPPPGVDGAGRGGGMRGGGMPPGGMPPGGMPPEMQGRPGGRGGRGGGPGEGGTSLDPLVAANDSSKPLISKLLAVPKFRAQYLGYVKEIATKWLDWSVLGPIVEKHHALIKADVHADVKKLTTNEAFDSSMQGLKQFVDARRQYLLTPR